jgi:hypothetical protein
MVMPLIALLENLPDRAACGVDLGILASRRLVCPRRHAVGNMYHLGGAHYPSCNARRREYAAVFGTPFQGSNLSLRQCLLRFINNPEPSEEDSR